MNHHPKANRVSVSPWGRGWNIEPRDAAEASHAFRYFPWTVELGKGKKTGKVGKVGISWPSSPQNEVGILGPISWGRVFGRMKRRTVVARTSNVINLTILLSP
jgi:hypothetical protein